MTESKNPKIIPHCGGVMVFRNDQPLSCLLVKSQRNNYSFPKGKQEEKENILQASFRELEEETGLTCNDINILYGLNVFEYDFVRQYATVYYVAFLRNNVNPKIGAKDVGEIKSAGWYSIYDIPSLTRLRTKRKKLLTSVTRNEIFQKYLIN